MQWVLGEVCIVWEGVTQKKLRFGLWNCRIECFLPYLVAHGNREHRCVRSDKTQSREKYNQGRKEGLCKINLPHEFQKFTLKCRFSCDFLKLAPMLFDLLFNAFSFPLQEKKTLKIHSYDVKWEVSTSCQGDRAATLLCCAHARYLTLI